MTKWAHELLEMVSKPLRCKKNPECKEAWDDWQEIDETAAVKRADGGKTDSRCRYVYRFVYYVHVTDERRARF